MLLTADYHTHTVFSHGKGQILDNAISAKNVGLKQVAISDHGFSHPAFGLTKKKVPEMLKLIDEAKKETGVDVLMGIESNIVSTDGRVDLTERAYDNFDVFLAGIHKFVFYKFKSIFSLAIPNMYHTFIEKKRIPKSVIKANTNAFVNAIKNNPVDMITHLNFFCFADALEVAKVASDYGTYLELNAKKVHLTDEEIEAVLKTDVRFLISSDAHTPERVGEISLVEDTIKRLNFPTDRIDNIDGKIPNLRFKQFKEGRL